jgi:hypothetical protein
MDAAKMHHVNKVCEEIAKATLPQGLKADFSGIKDGKGPGFSMTVSFGEREPSGQQLDLPEGRGS